MSPQKMTTDKNQKIEDKIQALRSSIVELQKDLQNMTTDKDQKIDEIQALRSAIVELQKDLIAMEHKLCTEDKKLETEEKKIKGLKKYLISWMRFLNRSGEEVIEASSEEEALQIARENVYLYDGKMDGGPEEPFIESWGEVEE